MDPRFSIAAFLVFSLSTIIEGYEASAKLSMSTKTQYSSERQCVPKACCLNGGTRNELPDGTYRCYCPSGFTGIICETGCKSLTDDGGVNYIGIQSWTFTKKTCQRWDSQIPHNHTHTDATEFDGSIKNLSQAENYCRNPDDEYGRPWCFTTDPGKRWEYCDIPFCKGCKHTDIGAEYTGTSNTDCLRWDAVNHSYTPANFPDGIKTLSQVENYCRNPNNNPNGPWCYINDTRGLRPWDCEVPFCQGCHEDSYYDGTKSTTHSGLPCQRWDSQSPNVNDPTIFQVSSEFELTHVNEAENYCRIIDGVSNNTGTKPWCYTIANTPEWEYCDVPECE